MAKQGESGLGKRGPVEAAALFPRLHVSHAKRDNGPRPPPRNKMALYEQVTLQPSHPKAAAASGPSPPSLQEEGPNSSGMQAPKARMQPESLPSMVRFMCNSGCFSRLDFAPSIPHLEAFNALDQQQLQHVWLRYMRAQAKVAVLVTLCTDGSSVAFDVRYADYGQRGL